MKDRIQQVMGIPNSCAAAVPICIEWRIMIRSAHIVLRIHRRADQHVRRPLIEKKRTSEILQ